MAVRHPEQPGPTVDVLIGGFCSSQRGYEPLRAAMQQMSGHETVFLGLTRWALFSVENTTVYPSVLYRQALHIARQMERRGIRRVRLYGHSFGSPLVMIVADVFGRAVTVEQIVLLNPACMHADGIWTTAKRFVRKILRDAHDMYRHPDETVRQILRAARPGVLMYVLNLPRTITEGVAISRNALFTAMYQQMSARGTPVYVGWGEHDTLFLPGAIREACAELPEGHVFMLEGTGHDAQFHPQQTAEALKRHGIL